MNKISIAIKKAMKNKRVNGKELCALTGLFPCQVSAILNDKVSVKFITVCNIACALDLTIQDLIKLGK